MKKAILFFAAACLVSLGTAAFAADKQVVVGSKIDTEGSLIGKMIVKLLAANGIPVQDRTGTGTTPVVRKAIIAGEIDVYPEYTGNGDFFFKGTDPTAWKDEKKGYETVKKLDLEQNGIVWLTRHRRTTRGRSRCARILPTRRSSSLSRIWAATSTAAGR